MADEYSKEQIEALLAGITPGEWRYYITGEGRFVQVANVYDQTFIENAPAIIRQQQARLAKLQAVADAARVYADGWRKWQAEQDDGSLTEWTFTHWLANNTDEELLERSFEALAAALKALDGES